MHHDHAGNLEAFPQAKILIQKEELKAAFSQNPSQYNMEFEQYDDIPQENFKVIPERYDVFGDGKFTILSAPGHTPGHQVAILKMRYRNVLLSGDLYHFEYNRRHQNVPLSDITHNRKKALDSIIEFEEKVEQQNLEVWIQHDPDQYETLRLSPAYYIF